MTGETAARCGNGKSLSWRSRDSNWWTSAVELSNSLATKIDQVPATIANLNIQWQLGSKDHQNPTKQPHLQRGSSFSSFSLPWKFNLDSITTTIKNSEPSSKPQPPPLDSPSSPNASRSALITSEARSSSRVGESRRRTKRMTVDVTPDAGTTPDTEASPQIVGLSTVSQEFLLGEAQAPGSARVHSLEVLQRQMFWTPREARTESPKVNSSEASLRKSDGLGSSRRSSQRSFRCVSVPKFPLFEGPEDSKVTVMALEDTKVIVVGKKPLEVLLPKEEIFPGNTTNLAQIKVGKPKLKCSGGDEEDVVSGGLSKHSMLGGSSRAVPTNDVVEEDGDVVCAPVSVPTHDVVKENGDVVRAPVSVPSSPRCVSVESRTSKFMRKLKLGGWSSDTKSGKDSAGSSRKLTKTSSMSAVSDNTALQRHKFAKTVEPRKLETSYPSARKQEGNTLVDDTPEKKIGSRWVFKWRWGSKTSSKGTKTVGKGNSNTLNKKSHLADPIECKSPTSEIMSDACDSFVVKSDRFSSMGSTEKLGTPKHRRVLSWGSCSTASDVTPFTPSHPRLPTRAAQELLVPPRRLRVSMGGNEPTMISGELGVVATPPEPKASTSISRGDPLRCSEGEVFEDCCGSFRSVDSPTRSHGSFRSVDSPSFSGNSVNKSSQSMEEVDWDGPFPLNLQPELDAVVEEAAAPPCSLPLHSEFHSRDIEQLNNFLTAQKKRLLSSLEKGNTDCFCIVMSGTGADLEVSSMVAAMCYAWMQENTTCKMASDRWHAVPMIDIPRHLMHKHKDAAWLFDVCGIDAGSLLFANEIELSSLMAAGRIKMWIVGQDVLVTKNEVGSVCTLLAEALVSEAPTLLQPHYTKSLLLAGILLDTENLDFASMRDTEMTAMLDLGSRSLGRTGFFNQLRQVDHDSRVTILVTENYGEENQISVPSRTRDEAEHEHSDRDSIFTLSQDQTSTSEAGTNSSLDEDSPRLKQRSSFKYSRLISHSAPARSNKLSTPSGLGGRSEDAKAVAHIRKAATQSIRSGPSANESRGVKTSSFTKIRKKLFIYEAKEHVT